MNFTIMPTTVYFLYLDATGVSLCMSCPFNEPCNISLVKPTQVLSDRPCAASVEFGVRCQNLLLLKRVISSFHRFQPKLSIRAESNEICRGGKRDKIGGKGWFFMLRSFTDKVKSFRNHDDGGFGTGDCQQTSRFLTAV